MHFTDSCKHAISLSQAEAPLGNEADDQSPHVFSPMRLEAEDEGPETWLLTCRKALAIGEGLQPIGIVSDQGRGAGQLMGF
jgi:hypothetical protein